jgi:hypothetical protein
LSCTLSNKKKHPFLAGNELQNFVDLAEKLLSQLESQKTELLGRLTNDEILEFVELLFSGNTGAPFDDAQMRTLAAEGESRYQNEIPPGYKDGKKNSSGDPYRKYGDLIVWKQLIRKAKDASKPIIFVTDDKKEDWWLEQSGRTIGPRVELREEFIKEASKDFWMYTVDKFMEEAANISNTKVSEEAIAEIIEVSEVAKSESLLKDTSSPQASQKSIHPILSEDEILDQLTEFLDSHPSDDNSVGLRYFVVNYLGRQNYEINHSYARLNALSDREHVEIFKKEQNGISSMRIRLRNNG